MIIFAIPLRARETANDWNGVLCRFQRTIKSIFNQTNPEFRCIVACNQVPKMDAEYDERLEFIALPDMPIPQTWLEMARDKFWKLTMIAIRIHEILEEQESPESGIYVMPVDADDLLSCRIAQHCVAFPNEHGFVSRDGYVWNCGKPFFRIHKEMYTYCGSCNIIKMYLDDLPETCPALPELCHDQETAAVLNARYPIRFDHNVVVERYKKEGRPFSFLPFRSTVYIRDTGDNISMIAAVSGKSQDRKRDRFHPVAFLRSINIFKMKPITGYIKREFGMSE